MNKINYTIIVSTSKSYESILRVFIHFFKVNFSNSVNFIVISDNLNENTFKDKNIKVFCKESNWSSRMLHAVKNIQTDYILFFFEDFLIKNKIKHQDLNEIFNYVEKNKIDFFKLNCSKRKIFNKLNLYNGFIIGDIPIDDLYPLPLQVAFWNKNFLVESLQFNLNQWQFEHDIKKYLNLKKYKRVTIVNKSPIIYYDRGLVIKGEIVRKELRFLNKNKYNLITDMKKENLFKLFYRTYFIFRFLRYIKYTYISFIKK